ncbi:MAG: hypothetical protein LBF15_01175 [Candidatus Peribacteria bacterium]|nr:hypothetical protein [Candidatus Peribacteria bacterium]
MSETLQVTVQEVVGVQEIFNQEIVNPVGRSGEQLSLGVLAFLRYEEKSLLKEVQTSAT